MKDLSKDGRRRVFEVGDIVYRTATSRCGKVVEVVKDGAEHTCSVKWVGSLEASGPYSADVNTRLMSADEKIAELNATLTRFISQAEAAKKL